MIEEDAVSPFEELTEEVFIDRARAFLCEVTGAETTSLEPDANLIEAGVLDSLLIIAFLAFVERLRGSELDVGQANFRAISSLRGAYSLARSCGNDNTQERSVHGA